MSFELSNRIRELNKRFPNHVRFQPQQLPFKEVAKYVSRLPGKLDRTYLELLRDFNSISIGDLFIYGIKERSNDIFEITGQNWRNCEYLMDYFITFGTTSVGQDFGFLIHIRSENDEAAIGSVRDYLDPSLTVISTSLASFLNTLLYYLEQIISTTEMDVRFVGEFTEILNNIDLWKQNDAELSKGYNLKLYRSSVEHNWKLAHGLY
jgi:hypothetical protein